MKREIQHVPYGYEPPASERKGTLVFYDSFEHISDQELAEAARTATERKFTKLVLYPLHEETVRRMTKEPVQAYYKREDRLHEWRREQGLSFITVETLEENGRNIRRSILRSVILATCILRRISCI